MKSGTYGVLCLFASLFVWSAELRADSVDIVIVVDSSASVGLVNFQMELDFAKALVMDQALPEDVRFALINYSDQIIAEFNLDTYGHPNHLPSVTSAIDSVPWLAGSSHQVLALEAAVQQLSTYSAGRPGLVILITDGAPNPVEFKICDDLGFVSNSLEQLRDMEVPLITIGVDFDAAAFGTYVDCLDEDDNGSEIFQAADFNGLSGILDALFSQCDIDEHVSGNVCLACPAGTTNEAGDDPTGGDTTCTAVLMCEGFAPPMDGDLPVRAKKNRVFPLKLQLFDYNGFVLTDVDLSAPPVVEVLFFGEDTSDHVDVSEQALSSGKGSEGNEFQLNDEDYWQFNLKSRNYSAGGRYLVTALSGDVDEYIIEPSCVASFVID